MKATRTQATRIKEIAMKTTTMTTVVSVKWKLTASDAKDENTSDAQDRCNTASTLSALLS